MSGEALRWEVREGSGLVLPIHGKLLLLNQPNAGHLPVDRLDLHVAKAYLEHALAQVERRLEQLEETQS